MIDNQTLIARDDSALFTRLGDKTVMMSLTEGDYYELDEIGTAIWEQIETPRSLSSLCDALAGEYAVSAEQCRADVVEFLGNLKTFGMIVLTEGATS